MKALRKTGEGVSGEKAEGRASLGSCRRWGRWGLVWGPGAFICGLLYILFLPLPASILSSLQTDTAQLRVDRDTDRACTHKGMRVIEDNFNLS